MVKENINGKMELTMKGISSKGLETVWENGTKIQTVFTRVNLNKIISMEKELSITKMEAIYKATSLKVKYQKVHFTIREDRSSNNITKIFREYKSHEII